MASQKDIKRPAERRIFNLTNCEVRAAEGDAPATFSGYAAVFNELSVNLGGFRERIQPGCFRNAVEEGQDVRFLINHDSSLLLGRTKSGTVTLVEDELGLRVECPLPDTTYANDLEQSMLRGDIDQMSFGFTTVSDAWKEKDKESGLPIRELVEANLFDVSVVTYPAYPDTSAEIRSLIEDQNPELLERAQRAAEELEVTPEVPADPEPVEPVEETERDDAAEAPETGELQTQYEQLRAEAGVRIEEGHPQCDGVAVVWNFNDECFSCHASREAAEAQVEAMSNCAARSDEERAGKTLSKANQEKLDEAVGLLNAVLEAAQPADDVDDAAIGDIVGLNSKLPDIASFRQHLEGLEELRWGYEDDWAVWSLTSMIESASIFLLYSDDPNEDDAAEDAAQAAAMKTILQQLTVLLAAVVDEGARSDEPAAEEETAEGEETRDAEPAPRFDKERRRLALVELEATVV